MRSTQTQKAKRLNTAYRLLSRHIPLAEAAVLLSREEEISLRHAYRYLQEAAQLEQPLPVPDPAQSITFKIPGKLIRALRTHAAAHKITLSEAATQAIQAFVNRDG